MPSVAVNGIDQYFDEHGTGDPVVLITGLGGVGKGWGEQIQRFAEDYRTIVPDHRGTGQSTHSQEGYAVENLAADMAGLLRHLDCGPAHLVGSSTGGAIAQVMALDHADVVRSITLASSWARGDDYFRHQFESRKQILLEIGKAAYNQVTALFLFSPQYVRDHHAEVQAWCEAAAAGGSDPVIMAKRIDMIMAYDQLERIDQIAVPTLVVVGTEDSCTPPYYSHELAEAIPGAVLNLLPGGHLIYKEDPEAFHRTVHAFLQSSIG